MNNKKIKDFIFYFIILLSIILFSIKFCIKDIQLFGITNLKVLSNSMEPEFKKGDIIFIKKQKDYNVGDIITYEIEKNYLVTHRIIEKYENEYITKGDANNIQDEEKIYENKIKGKVFFVLKNPLSIGGRLMENKKMD